MKRAWSKFPSRWIRDGMLRAFGSDRTAGCAAALKLYMSLSMFVSVKPTATAGVPGTVSITFSELESLCGISRRYVSRGIAMLARQELVTIEKSGNANRYILRHYDEIGWAKLPRGHLLEQGRFKTLSIRGPLYLDALKLYLALIAFRQNNSHQAFLSYDKIEHYTGTRRRHIRRAIDVLLNHEWLSIASNPVESSDQRPTNIYVLLGDFWGRPMNQNRVPTAQVSSGA